MFFEAVLKINFKFMAIFVTPNTKISLKKLKIWVVS